MATKKINSTVTQVKVNAVTNPVYTIKVIKQPKCAYRSGSARALYWARIAAFDGKPLTQLSANVVANPPSQPTKGKLTGKTEPLAGWVNFFVRGGYLQVVSN